MVAYIPYKNQKQTYSNLLEPGVPRVRAKRLFVITQSNLRVCAASAK